MSSDRASLPNSFQDGYYLKEAYTPYGHRPPAPRSYSYDSREAYVPAELGGLPSFQGGLRRRNRNLPTAVSESGRRQPLPNALGFSTASHSLNSPTVASTSAVQRPREHPFSGPNDYLIDQFQQRARQAGMNRRTIEGYSAALKHFGNWAGEGSLEQVLNSISSTYAQQTVRDWGSLTVDENPYGSKQRREGGGRGSGNGGAAITSFRRRFGWGKDDA